MTSDTFLTINLSSDLLLVTHPCNSLLSEVCKNENDNILVPTQRDWVGKPGPALENTLQAIKCYVNAL